MVKETLVSFPDSCVEVVAPTRDALCFDIPVHTQQFVLEKTLFSQLDLFGTHFPFLICRLPELPRIDFSEEPKGVELLCPLSDPLNAGALVRSCHAFGVDKLIFLQEAVLPFHPKALRASSGSIFSQLLCQGPSIESLDQFTDTGPLVALDVTGTPLHLYQWPLNVRILIGQEGQGLPSYSYSKTLAIPIKKTSDSLNAMVAASIALYAYRLQHPL